MLKTQERMRFYSVILIIGSILGIIFWLVMLFFAFFLGGSPSPRYERTVPLHYIYIMMLGFAATVIGFIMGIKSMNGINVSKAVIMSALLGVIGSVPFFLLELKEMWIIALIVGLIPQLIYLFLNKLSNRTK